MALNPLYSSLSHLGKKANGQKGGWGGGWIHCASAVPLWGGFIMKSAVKSAKHFSFFAFTRY